MTLSFQYRCFGLEFTSDVPLWPGDVARTGEGAPVTIRTGRVPANGLGEGSVRGPFLHVRPGQLWLSVPGIARFLVSEGTEITYRSHGAAPDLLGLFLRGPCLAALLMQRGSLVLRAAGVAIGGGAVLLSGQSGIGRSTLAAALMSRGFTPLTDEVSAVDASAQLSPGAPFLEIWQTAADHLGIAMDGLHRVRAELDRFLVPTAPSPAEPRPVSAVYHLSANNADELEFEMVRGMDTFVALQSIAYHRAFAEGLGVEARQMVISSAVTNQAPIIRLTRPRAGFDTDGLAQALLDDLKDRGLC